MNLIFADISPCMWTLWQEKYKGATTIEGVDSTLQLEINFQLVGMCYCVANIWIPF
jgi:hypothetical protein